MKTAISSKFDSVSMLRASNARLAALVGDSSRTSHMLSDARQLAAEIAMPVRAAR